MTGGPLYEKLAEIEHTRWAAWQQYLHSLCKPHIGQDGGPTGALLIPADLVARWERQIDTPYADLSEREKDSDRKEVGRYWHLISGWGKPKD